MGLDFAPSLRPSFKHDASALSAHRALSGSLHSWQRRLAGGLKRSSQAEAAGRMYKSGTLHQNGDGSCLGKGSKSCLYQERSFHHSSAGFSRHGFAANVSGRGFDVDEHFCCEISSLDNGSRCPSDDWKESKKDLAGASGVVAGVGVPLSLRMLKKKQQYLGKAALTSGLVEVGNSLLKAFSTMVFMMKELQSHCLHIQRQFFKQEIEGLLIQVHKEMQSSFLWLFQQVFSCTPELMVLVMVLLANFTAFSMANSMPMEKSLSITAPMPLLVTNVPRFASHMSGSGAYMQVSIKRPEISPPAHVDGADQLLLDNGWIGSGGKRSHKGYTAAGNGDGEFDSSKVFSSVNNQLYTGEDSNISTEMSSLSTRMSSLGQAVAPLKEGFNNEAELSSKRQSQSDDEFSSVAAALAFEELNIEEDIVSSSSGSESNAAAQRVHSSHAVGLSAQDDDYACYDRTDLDYQYALSGDASNSMLLANYAQFLFLVRKDHDRAEELFRRAVRCDPLDGNAISHFASFLWIARHNLSAAGEAYQEAVRADPCNSFHAANYAHFLWNSDQ